MKKVGRYVVISELGRGAMGVVYKASDPTIDREVALKVLSLSASHDEGTNSPQEMFMREVRAAGRLAHPSIVTIHDAFDDPANQTSCIVMELVPGVTLEKMLDSGKPPTVEQSLDLIRQVADGLDYAHRNKVIHRDLKPANILVTEDLRAKITDFGIAKVLAREGVARTIGIMGTPSYMSPEQVRGGEIDARTDIFSLGIMIFTILTGQKPFAGNTAAVMFKIVYEESALPSSVNPQLTAAHDYVVKKCLAKDRNQRYASARELVNDLDDLQHGLPPRSQAGESAPAPAARPTVAPSVDQAPATPIPNPMKASVKPQPPRMPPSATPLHFELQPPPRPSASLPDPPAASGSPEAPDDVGHTVAMPIAGLMKSVSRPAAPPSPPLASPVEPESQAPGSDHTVAMPIAGLMKSVSRPASPSAPPPAASVDAEDPVPADSGHTVAMPISELMKSVSRPAAPPASPPAAPVGAETSAPGSDRTVAMPIAGLMKSVSRPAAPPSPPPAAPVEAKDPVPDAGHTVAMPISELMKSVSHQAPAAPPPVPTEPPRPAIPPPFKPPSAGQPLTGKTLVMRVPDLSAISSQPQSPAQGTRVPPAAPDSPLMERTQPMRVPDLSAVSPAHVETPDPSQMDRTKPLPVPDLSTVSSPTATLTPAQESPLIGRTRPMPVPDLSSVSPSPVPTQRPTAPAPPEDDLFLGRTIQAGAPDVTVAATAPAPQPGIAPPPALSDATQIVQDSEVPAQPVPAQKSKLLPVMVGVAALFFLVLVVFGYRKFQKARADSAALVTQTQTPPPTAVPVVNPTPPPVEPVAPPPVSATPDVTKKPIVRKPKPAVAHPTPAPAPPPQPEPVVVAPPPQPVPSGPSPADIAKAEAAKLANTPRIINVVCNFGLKEATFIFSGGGKTIYQETIKGKKKKGGFLGIKGSFEGTFSHTLTVPAGVSQLTLHVESKDGSTDVTNAIKMPSVGGFVPTLSVQADSDHVALNWKSSSGAE